MDNIILNATQSKIIDDCCEKLNINDDYEANTTLYDSVINLEEICNDLQRKLNKLQDAAIDVKLSVADHNVEKIVQSLKIMSDLAPDFSPDVNAIVEATTDAVVSFKSASE